MMVSRRRQQHKCFHYEEKKEEEEEAIAPSSSSLSTRSQTSVTSYKETEHARQRRQQRGIDKKDVKAAIRYGTRQRHVWGTNRYSARNKSDPNVYRYSYNDIHYIVNDTTKEEITCYTTPITLDCVPTTQEMEEFHIHATQMIQVDLNSWTSHTVMVIDTSGSMKNSDMWGSRNRLQGVWLSIALDFVAQRLESGTGTYTDVISIIVMGGAGGGGNTFPEVIFREVPTTWVLYNEIATMYNRRLSKPQGHGYFVPSLLVAEQLLKRNTNASCAAALIFLSDGAPSDKGPNKHQMIIETVQSLATQFGRRLVFTTVGFGALEQYDTLQSMVDTAKDYGTIAELKLPGMTSSSLGVTFTSIATSLTSTQTEMTAMDTTVQRKVRDVYRESRKKASQPLEEISTDDFHLYRCEDVKRKIRIENIDSFGRMYVYYQQVPLQNTNAKFVAISKGAFGEGAERFAYRFYELAQDGKTVVGVPMVAKESRMQYDAENVAGNPSKTDVRYKFEEIFIQTQQIANRLGKQFNEKLQSDPRIHRDTPRIAFLECSVYELNDMNVGQYSVLVEERLDENQWYKWNSNNGLVNGIRQIPMDMNDNVECMLPDTATTAAAVHSNGCQDLVTCSLSDDSLDTIQEDSEEEEEDEVEVRENRYSTNYTQPIDPIVFTPSQVAQAFSHFTYHQSAGQRLVCDLQGVYDSTKHVLYLSDPVIHSNHTNPKHPPVHPHPSRRRNKCVYGRTDRGCDGMDDFFVSHCCMDQGGLCQWVTNTTTGSSSTRTTRQHGFQSIRSKKQNHHALVSTRKTTTGTTTPQSVSSSSSLLCRRNVKSYISQQQVDTFLWKEMRMWLRT